MCSAFLVCEAGINHLGDRAKMLAFCDAAKACGASAVKFQAYDSAKLYQRRFPPERFEAMTPSEASKRDEWLGLVRKAELTDADLDAIAAHCKAIGFKHFYSVFDPSQVERVLSRGACALKIGHKEADWDDLRSACASGRTNIRLWISNPPYDHWGAVWCVDKYPADGTPPSLIHIGERPDSANFAFVGGYSGFSSHYTDYRIPAAAALRGAEYIEAHMKLSDQDPEAAWSLRVGDFTKMVKLAREYESWL